MALITGQCNRCNRPANIRLASGEMLCDVCYGAVASTDTDVIKLRNALKAALPLVSIVAVQDSFSDGWKITSARAREVEAQIKELLK